MVLSNHLHHIQRFVLALAITGVVAAPAAAELEIGGSSALEIRVFPNKTSYAGQRRATLSPSIVLEPEFIYVIGQGDDTLTLTPFMRLDSHDERRSHYDIREMTWVHLADNWDTTIGIGKIFWGVTESRHLVDIINQTDTVEGADGEDKLGQPLFNLNIITDWGTVGGYVLPGFRERTFADDDARLRGPKPIQADDATYDSSAGNKHVDLALRWSHTFGDVDIGLSQFYGTSREPGMKSVTRFDGVAVFQPHYDIINQSALELQLTSGPWLWKLESIVRRGHGKDFMASVAGFEYTFYQIAESPMDIGVLAEYLYDGRDSSAPVTLADDDIFMGARLVFNDVEDSSILAGVVVDKNSRETSMSFEAERRLSDQLKIQAELRWFARVPDNGSFSGIKNDDFLMIRLARFF